MSVHLTEDNKTIAEINIIPFVDIILVILILFMVTAPFINKTGFSLELPESSSAKPVKPSKIHILIQPDGRVLLNGADFSLDTINQKLEAGEITKDNTHVVISADRAVTHGTVISVINSVKSVGLSKVAITTRQFKKQTP